jgi:hypothetical protein
MRGAVALALLEFETGAPGHGWVILVAGADAASSTWRAAG